MPKWMRILSVNCILVYLWSCILALIVGLRLHVKRDELYMQNQKEQ